MYHIKCNVCGAEYDCCSLSPPCGVCGAVGITATKIGSWNDQWHEDFELEARKMEAGQPGDEPSDIDQLNPVNVSAEVWSDIYARHPELLDHD